MPGDSRTHSLESLPKGPPYSRILSRGPPKRALARQFFEMIVLSFVWDNILYEDLRWTQDHPGRTLVRLLPSFHPSVFHPSACHPPHLMESNGTYIRILWNWEGGRWQSETCRVHFHQHSIHPASTLPPATSVSFHPCTLPSSNLPPATFQSHGIK